MFEMFGGEKHDTQNLTHDPKPLEHKGKFSQNHPQSNTLFVTKELAFNETI